MRPVSCFVGVILCLFSLGTLKPLIAEGGPPPEAEIRREIEGIGLTEQQKERLKRLIDESRRRTDEIFKQLRDKRRELDRLLSEYNLDEKEAMQIIQQINSLQRKLLRERLETHIQVRKILTPEQFEKYNRILQKYRPRFHPRPSFGSPPPHPKGQ